MSNNLQMSHNINRNQLSLRDNQSLLCCHQIKKFANIEEKNQQLIKECSLLNDEKIKLKDEINELNEKYNKLKEKFNCENVNLQNTISQKISTNESLIDENNNLHLLIEDKNYEIENLKKIIKEKDIMISCLKEEKKNKDEIIKSLNDENNKGLKNIFILN